MFRFGASAFGLVFLLIVTALPGAGADADNPGAIENQFLELRKEYQTDLKAVEGNDEKMHALATSFAPRFLVLGTKNAEDEAAPDPLLWILINAPQSPEMPKAAKLLEKQYLQSSRLKPKLQALHSSAPEVEHFLRAVMNKSSDKDTQAVACFTLAQLLKDKAGDDHPKLRQDAMSLLDQCVSKFADCPVGKGATIGERAKPLLFEMRNLVIGHVVPEIVGEDLDGNSFKLSEYRGKVVMLSYWATWCPACMGMVPHERALVKRLEGQPFVLIGVNGDAKGDKKKVQQRMEKEQITWRSYWNGGAIAAKWNVEYWPAIFIIDHAGIIRHRLGATDAADLDQAINPLVAAAKRSAGKK